VLDEATNRPVTRWHAGANRHGRTDRGQDYSTRVQRRCSPSAATPAARSRRQCDLPCRSVPRHRNRAIAHTDVSLRHDPRPGPRVAAGIPACLGAGDLPRPSRRHGGTLSNGGVNPLTGALSLAPEYVNGRPVRSCFPAGCIIMRASGPTGPACPPKRRRGAGWPSCRVAGSRSSRPLSTPGTSFRGGGRGVLVWPRSVGRCRPATVEAGFRGPLPPRRTLPAPPQLLKKPPSLRIPPVQQIAHRISRSPFPHDDPRSGFSPNISRPIPRWARTYPDGATFSRLGPQCDKVLHLG